MNYSVKNEFYEITVSTYGAELCSVKNADGAEMLWQNEPAFWDAHAPLLFPTCGKLKDAKYRYKGKEYPMAGHGFAMRSEFELVNAANNHIIMRLSSSEATRAIYPFDFTVTADYELRGEEILFTFTVKNDGEETLPYMFGWHPAFKLPSGEGRDINDYKLYFGKHEALEWHPLQNGVFVCPVGKSYPLENGSYRLNEEEIYANDTMIFLGHDNRVTLSADGYPFALEMSWSDNLPVLCIWKETDNAARFICIEPWSSYPADGVTPEDFETRNMARLAPEKSEAYRYSLRFNCK